MLKDRTASCFCYLVVLLSLLSLLPHGHNAGTSGRTCSTLYEYRMEQDDRSLATSSLPNADDLISDWLLNEVVSIGRTELYTTTARLLLCCLISLYFLVIVVFFNISCIFNIRVFLNDCCIFKSTLTTPHSTLNPQQKSGVSQVCYLNQVVQLQLQRQRQRYLEIPNVTPARSHAIWTLTSIKTPKSKTSSTYWFLVFGFWLQLHLL